MKASFLIISNFESSSNLIVFNFSQKKKALLPIIFTFFGIVILLIEVKEKALLLILVNFESF